MGMPMTEQQVIDKAKMMYLCNPHLATHLRAASSACLHAPEQALCSPSSAWPD